MSVQSQLPLIGRLAELTVLRGELDACGIGRGGVMLLRGEGGIGKSRLAAALLQEARDAGWAVASGRAYAAESGVPYSLFADALLPVLNHLPAETRTVITRGAEAELVQIFPTLRSADAVPAAPVQLPDVKNRLLWNFTQVLKTLCGRAPMMIVLEDLQWADVSSLELLHFVARQTATDRLLIVASYNTTLRDENSSLVTVETSLLALGRARALDLCPLTHSETGELIERVFGVDAALIGNFVSVLYGWTRGNPFFITEVLDALIAAGALTRQGEQWTGWDVEQLELPRSIRDALMVRLARLSNGARQIADILAARGRQTSFELLCVLAGQPEGELSSGLEELIRSRMIEERTRGSSIWYDFAHPLTREAVHKELGETRASALHARLGLLTEQFYGDTADAYADELAFHFGKARSQEYKQKAIHYLLTAGKRALQAYANREAEAYFADALRRVTDPQQRAAVCEELARAMQRLGNYDGALQLWQEARDHAAQSGAAGRVAAIERRIGLAYFWSGNPDEAMLHYEAGLEAALAAEDLTQQVQLRIARAMCMQEIGRFEEGLPDGYAALEAAQTLGDPSAMARAHRALLLLHCWTGPADVARAHGHDAIRLVQGGEDRTLAWSAHWATAVLEGLTGNAPAMLEHLRESERLADELRSPVLRLWSNELAIEYGFGSGEWNRAIQLGENSIQLARALNQRTLLPRLLVWTALMHLARNETERAKSYIDEAWKLSGAGDPRRRQNVHSVVPAHIGMAAYFLAICDYPRAIEIGTAGLAVADKTSYVVWAVHRLIPIIAESMLYMHDVEAAGRVGARLRLEATRLDHKLGLAWADACDALIAWLAGDPRTAAVMLRASAEQLERIPYVLDAARVRRQLAGRLADIGEHEAAVAELRRVHDMLSALGAERELTKAREMFREMGARLPPRAPRSGAAGLTERELEIARMVAGGKSNKSIGKALGISVRTVGTHVSNIYKKLGVTSRDALLAVLREQPVTMQQR